MRAVTLVVLCTVGLLMLTPTPASADGGAALDFQEEFVPPGDVATARTVVWMGEKDVRRLEQGPYQAYLLPDEKWIEPPYVPADAILVGAIEFTPPEGGTMSRLERKLGAQKGLATLSFVVPDIPTDSYGVYYCNDPCTIATIGDLTGGWIRIAEDAEEAQLLAERERAGWKATSLKWRVERARKQIDRLTAESLAASGEATRLGTEVENLREQLQAVSDRDRGGLDPAAVIVAGLGGLLIGLLFRRRRRPAQPGSPVAEAERILHDEPTVTTSTDSLTS